MSNYKQIERLINALSHRNIKACHCTSLPELEAKLLDTVPLNATVGIGNSQTLKKIKLTQKLEARGSVVFDKTSAGTREESRKLSREALLADWYISSANAVSMDGHIVNIDHTGNRAAALIYGPRKVIVVIGFNKITENLEAAVARARDKAAIQNAKRAGFNPPCVIEGRCLDCRSRERVCNYLMVIEGQVERERLQVFIVDDHLGF